MNSVHQRLAEAGIAHWLRDPDSAAVLIDYLKNLDDGYYGKWLVEVIFQGLEGQPRRFSIHNAYCFGQIHANICLGNIALVSVDVGTTPQPDTRMPQMQDHLAQWFRAPLMLEDNTHQGTSFSCRVWGGKADADGILSWSVPLRMQVFGEDPEGHETISSCVVAPGSAPLEVGYTNASRTLMHLIQGRALARWPYGHDRITILKVINDRLWSSLSSDKQ